MAIAAVTRASVGTQVDLYTWASMANGDSGTPLEITNLPDKTVQFVGTFGTGGTALFEGSNDGVSYFTLRDAGSTLISKTVASISTVLEHPRFVRPRASAGDGTTAIVATLMARRGTR